MGGFGSPFDTSLVAQPFHPAAVDEGLPSLGPASRAGFRALPTKLRLRATAAVDARARGRRDAPTQLRV